jgi:hypothetical protein
MILTVKMKRIFREATVLSVLVKVYTIPCHYRRHINVTLVLQSCTDPLQVLPGSSSETFPSSDCTNDVSNTAVEENLVVIERGFTAINKELDVGIKQQEIPECIFLPDIKTEPDEVSYACVCLLSDTFCQCPEISVVFVMLIFLVSWYSYMVEYENILFSPYRKKSIFSGCFLNTRQI